MGARGHLSVCLSICLSGERGEASCANSRQQAAGLIYTGPPRARGPACAGGALIGPGPHLGLPARPGSSGALRAGGLAGSSSLGTRSANPAQTTATRGHAGDDEHGAHERSVRAYAASAPSPRLSRAAAHSAPASATRRCLSSELRAGAFPSTNVGGTFPDAPGASERPAMPAMPAKPVKPANGPMPMPARIRRGSVRSWHWIARLAGSADVMTSWSGMRREIGTRIEAKHGQKRHRHSGGASCRGRPRVPLGIGEQRRLETNLLSLCQVVGLVSLARKPARDMTRCDVGARGSGALAPTGVADVARW